MPRYGDPEDILVPLRQRVFDFATLSSGWIERTIVIDSEYFGHLVLAIEQFETGIH